MTAPLHSTWVVYGDPDQVTGGYLYDRLIGAGLRALGDHAGFASIAPGSDPQVIAGALSRMAAPGGLEAATVPVLIGDGLCIPELAPAMPLLPRAVARVLLVHHLKSWEEPHPALRSLEAAALGMADRCVVTSEATGRRLLDEHPAMAGRVDVVHPGADRLPRLPAAARGNPLQLLFVGSLLRRKRVPRLLAALERLGRGGVRLRIVGDPGREPGAAAEVAGAIAGSRYLSQVVECAGAVSDLALAEELARADGLVLPSDLEGYGMVLAEALHAGVPVIAAAAAGGTREAVGDGSAALLFELDDGAEHPAGLAATLARFLDEPGLRARLRARAEAAAAALPRWSDQAASFREALRRAVSAVTGDRARARATAR